MQRIGFLTFRAAALVLLLAACSTETGSATLALNDPDSLLDELTGPLRLAVVPGEAYSCSEALGLVSPSPALPGAVDDLVVDITLDVIEGDTQVSASAEVSLGAGSWVIWVSGAILDPESGEAARATGCATIDIGLGETREASIMLQVEPDIGVCGDGLVDQTEQCDDGGVEAGDGCDPSCMAERLNVIASGSDGDSQRTPSIAWSSGQRAVISYQNMANPIGIRARFLDDEGQPISSPGFLRDTRPLRANANALAIETSQGATRTNLVYVDVIPASTPPPFSLISFEQTNSGTENYVSTDIETGQMDCSNPTASIASLASGAALILVECPSAIATVLVAADGTPGSVASLPNSTDEGAIDRIRASAFGGSFAFTYALTSTSAVGLQRLDTSGELDGDPIVIAGTADADSFPRLADLADGTALVVWQEGGKVRGQIVQSGETAPTGEAFDISEGPGSAPSVAGGESHFVVAYLNASAPGQDGEARARYLDGMGRPVLHRGPESTTGSFQIQATDAFDIQVAANDNQAMFAWRDRATEAAGDIVVMTLPLP